MRESTAVQVLQGESDIVSKGRSSILVSVVMVEKKGLNYLVLYVWCMAWYGIIMACNVQALLIVYLFLYHLRIPENPCTFVYCLKDFPFMKN